MISTRFVTLCVVYAVVLCVAQVVASRSRGTDLDTDLSSTRLKFNAYQSLTSTPQQSDFPEVPYLSSKPNTAIAFTGGGARAYVAAIGYLAGLNQLDLIKNVRYIGGISGGSWATTTFTFAQNVKSDDDFLGNVTYPEDMSEAGLQVMSSTCARSFAAPNLTLIGMEAYFAGTVDSPAEAWTYAIQQQYLNPAAIPDGSYFSWNSAVVSDIKSRNSALKKATFTLPTNADRPFPVLGTTVNGPTSGGPYDEHTQNFTMLELTPLYVGQFKKQSVAYDYTLGVVHHKTVGGAIEPFAFSRLGSDSPLVGLASTSASGSLSLDLPEEPFDLKHAAALSSYAPGTFFESLPGNYSEKLGMTMDYWSPSDVIPSGSQTFFGDGGSYQNINLISFLQRRVEKIVLFFNSNTPLLPASDWDVASNYTYAGQVTDSLSCFFGVCDQNLPWYANRSYNYAHDQVFTTNDYITVIQGLQAAQAAGNGIVATFTLTTIANDWWGIPAGVTSEITFVYLGRVSGWEAKLTPEMYSLLVPSDPEDAADLSKEVASGTFKHFPNYATTGGSINAERANALADLCGWVVLENAKLFESILS